MSHTESGVDDITEDTDENVENEEDILYDEEVIEEEPLVLRSEDFISGPFCGEHSTIPENILEFEYPLKKSLNLF